MYVKREVISFEDYDSKEYKFIPSRTARDDSKPAIEDEKACNESYTVSIIS